MSFPRYPSYKESSAKWIGIFPGHWKSSRLRWLARRYSGGTPDKANLAYWTDGTVPWLNSGAVNDRLITEPSTYITEEAFASSSARWIPEGALLMALAGQGKTKGMVARLAATMTCNQSMAAIVPAGEIDPGFLFWWLDSNYRNIRNLAGGDLRDGLNLDLIGDIQCPLPEKSEQTAIAAFLDRETSKIDALVAEQRRLLELLKEKRQAVISHAVTKGLNPDAPMKDSGVEWLGEVPAHWDITRVKRLSSRISKGTTPSTVGAEFTSSGVRFIKAENVTEAGVISEPEFYISDEVHATLNRSALQRGDVLVVIAGATTGKSSVLGADLLPANTNQAVSFVRPVHGLTGEFIQLWVSTPLVQAQIALGSVQSAQPNLSMEDLGNMVIPLPPLDERERIEAAVSSQVELIDRLVGESKRAVDLLLDRRTALIFAAVRGQVDVRHLSTGDALPIGLG